MDKIFTDFGPNLNNPVMLRAMMLPRHGVFGQRLGYDMILTWNLAIYSNS